MFYNQPFIQSHPHIWERDKGCFGDPSSDRVCLDGVWRPSLSTQDLLNLRCNKSALTSIPQPVRGHTYKDVLQSQATPFFCDCER